MCGRFAVTLPNDAMAQAFQAQPANALPEVPNYNVCPTDPIHVVYNESETRKLGMMRWGFTPSWYKALNDGPLLINARAETIAEKPAFREACRQRRCIIPMSGFYEWDRSGSEKLPWYIQPQGQSSARTEVQDSDSEREKDMDAAQNMFAFAGIWQEWRAINGDGEGADLLRTCAMVTVAANDVMSKIHHRMPVALARQDWGLWLGEEGHGAAPLMRPAPEEAMLFHRVSKEVNANSAAGPQLIEPLS